MEIQVFHGEFCRKILNADCLDNILPIHHTLESLHNRDLSYPGIVEPGFLFCLIICHKHANSNKCLPLCTVGNNINQSTSLSS